MHNAGKEIGALAWGGRIGREHTVSSAHTTGHPQTAARTIPQGSPLSRLENSQESGLSIHWIQRDGEQGDFCQPGWLEHPVRAAGTWDNCYGPSGRLEIVR